MQSSAKARFPEAGEAIIRRRAIVGGRRAIVPETRCASAVGYRADHPVSMLRFGLPVFRSEVRSRAADFRLGRVDRVWRIRAERRRSDSGCDGNGGDRAVREHIDRQLIVILNLI